MTSFTLPNGLAVFLLPSDSPFTAVVLGYRVGAAHEKPGTWGLAHLLEHLLFEDEHIGYDKRLQQIGGSTNAYTGQDYTVYYAQVGRQAAYLPLQLEAQRLFDLKLTPEKVTIQQQVVAEEFRQRYLNPPYADRFFPLLKAAFPDHPYAQMVIGESPESILQLPYSALEEFYQAYYAPRHAVLCVAGGGIDEGLSALIQETFMRDKPGKPLPPVPPVEGLPLQPLFQTEKDVPATLVTWAFRLPPLEDPATPAIDLLDDFLGDARSGLLPETLVRTKRLASQVQSYVWSFYQGGLWIIEGYLTPGTSIAAYEAALRETLDKLLTMPLEGVLARYRPQKYLTLHKQREKALNKALALVHAVLAGHLEWYLDPLRSYEELTPATLREVAAKYLQPDRLVRLHYIARKSGATG